MTSRKEIAKKLRYLSDCPIPPVQYAEQFRDLLQDAIIQSIKDPDYSETFDQLANLIDPVCSIDYTDTSTNTPDTGYNSDGYYYCSNCGELDSCFADMWDTYQANDYEGEPPFRYCPNCGARVVSEDAKKHC